MGVSPRPGGRARGNQGTIGSINKAGVSSDGESEKSERVPIVSILWTQKKLIKLGKGGKV